MARKPRFTGQGYCQHVIQRGLDRQACFYSPSECRLYLELLEEAARQYDCHVHAYVLMTNHVHLLVTQHRESGLSYMMQALSQRYVRKVNRRYNRTGTLWEGRYRAGLVDTDRYLLTCMRYIELNPVRADMVDQPSSYAWSSYRCNAHGEPDTVISPHPLYSQLGNDQASCCPAYRKLFASHVGNELLDEIRQSVNQELVLGSNRFKRQVEAMLGRQVETRARGRPRSC